MVEKAPHVVGPSMDCGELEDILVHAFGASGEEKRNS